jgi:DNA-binding transcriptional MerR regulator
MLDANQIAEIVRQQDHDPQVSSSTLHYYVQVGILPPAVGRGRSGYTPEHLSRFRLARRMKRQGSGLAEIRERLRDMSPAAVASELSTSALAGEVAEARRGTPLAGEVAEGRRGGRTHKSPPTTYRLAPPAAAQLRETAAPQLDDAATRYSNATEALRARSGDTPRTLRFRGGFSLQVPAGTSDEQIARLYTAVEAALERDAGDHDGRHEEDESR